MRPSSSIPTKMSHAPGVSGVSNEKNPTTRQRMPRSFLRVDSSITGVYRKAQKRCILKKLSHLYDAGGIESSENKKITQKD